MKRSWIGLGLLVVLACSALLVSRVMATVHQPIAAALTDAADQALAGSWQTAETLYRQALEDWERSETFRACFADHNPMEEIDGCFARLEVYARQRRTAAFAAQCAEIARKAEAMGDTHSLKWENLF